MTDYWKENGLIKPTSCIVCAANRHKTSGRIICGPRHWDNVMRSQKLESEKWSDFEQGFVNQFGEWFSRKEAYIIAEKNDQIRFPDHGSYDKETLYSEMLY